MWCMLNLSADTPLKEWLVSLPDHMPGNRMDGVNTLLTILPPQDVLDQLPEGKIVYLPEDADTLTLVFVIGSTLSLDSDDSIIIGRPVQWEAAYNTPYWRLWCAPNMFDSDDDEQYQSDLSALGLPSSTTRADARAIIKALVSGG